MNKIKIFIEAVAASMVIMFINGCATTNNVTRDYAHYNTMSKQEAMRVLSDQKWNDPYTRTVNDTSVSAESYGPIVDRREPIAIPGRIGSEKVYYHYGLIQMGDIYFNEITRIQLLLYSDRCVIRLYKSGHLGGWLLHHIDCDKNPEVYNKILSALLVLCPNIK